MKSANVAPLCKVLILMIVLMMMIVEMMIMIVVMRGVVVVDNSDNYDIKTNIIRYHS